MPHSPHAPFPVLDARSPASSLTNDSLFAERIATPTFPRNLRPPPPIHSPLHDAAKTSKKVEDTGSHNVLSTSSRASHSTGAADPVFASLNHSFSHPPLGVTLDEEQRRCVNTAFHISFHGNPRVKHKPTSVELTNGAAFLIVDRFVSGNCDGVYDKNKKMWEQIPLGQARVFARLAPSARTMAAAASATGQNEEADNVDGARRSTALTSSLRASPQSVPRSPSSSAFSPSPPPPLSSSNNNNSNNGNEWTYVATAVGLRKMGHWREATTVFSLHKEVAKSAIALEKVDGESGQLSAFTWLGVRYWVVGCRYQHIVTRLEVPETDLVRYAAAAASSSSDSSSSSSAASPSDGTVEGGADVVSPTCRTEAANGDGDQRSVHSSSMTAATTALVSGGLASEAGYLDLAVRMARLWRRVLEAIPCHDEASSPALADDSEEGRAARVARWEALHESIAADRRSLCFDAILTGWERLQTFSADHDFVPDTASSASSSSEGGTATPASSSASPRTAQLNSSTVFASPSLTTATTTHTWEAEIPLWFYAVTWDQPLDVRGWCLPVRAARRFLAKAHLPVVPASAEVQLGSAAYEALRQSVLSRCDTAGAVLYGSNLDAADNDSDDASTEDKSGMVVQVWKCRAYPHTLERVVQEYVVTHRLCGDPLRNKMKKKVSSLSRETRLYIKQWELHRLPFLVDFALWLHREKYITPSTDLAALKNIRGHWLSYQEKFQEVLLAQLQRQQQRLSARPSSLSTLDVSRKEERVAETDADDANSEAAAEGEESVDAVMLVGPQGCGKSTMARILYALLEEAGAAPRWLNQDEVGSRTAYLAAIRRAITRGTYSHVLLDKMNLDDKARADYGDVGVKPVLVVAWTHNSGTEAMVNACYDRVVQRGACHRTFFHGESTRSGQSPSLSPSMSSRSPELRPAATPPAELVASPISGGSVPASWLSAAASPSGVTALSPSFGSLVAADSGTRAAAAAAPSSSSRLHGILEASAKRYQAPSSMPCVELDVTWDCQRAVGVVWEALRDKGTCELPPLSELNVDAALQTAYAYERLLEAYPTRVAAAVLRGPSGEAALELLGTCRPPVIPKTQRLQTQVEVLLHDFQLNPSPTALVRYASQIDAVRRLTVQAVVSNSKVVLLLVLGPSESVAAAAARVGSEGRGGAVMISGETSTANGTNTGAPAVTSPTVSQDLEDFLVSQTRQEQWAVVAKAKKVTVEYCETLAQRVRDDPEEDPYCAVRWLSPPVTLDFTVAFTFP